MADKDEDEFEIGALLGAPVRAIQEAQIEAERQFVEFLFDYGLESRQITKDGKQSTELAVREVAFNMTRHVPDPTEPGSVVPVNAEVKAPLLSLMQMPAVGIQEADVALELDVQVEGSEESTVRRSANATATRKLKAALPDRRTAPVRLKGSVGARKLGRKFRTHGKLSVNMKLRATHDDDLHGRLSRLIGEGLTAVATPSDE